MSTKSELIAGEEALESFCIKFFTISDPIIVVWLTDIKPTLSQDKSASIDIVDDVTILKKEHINSLFFPHGFSMSDWNLVLVSVKTQQTSGKYAGEDNLVKGWMMGIDIESLDLLSGKFLIKL